MPKSFDEQRDYWKVGIGVFPDTAKRICWEVDFTGATILLWRGQPYRPTSAKLWHSRANDRNHPHGAGMRVPDVGDHLIEVRHGGFA
jgi:hypothetical protein